MMSLFVMKSLLVISNLVVDTLTHHQSNQDVTVGTNTAAQRNLKKNHQRKKWTVSGIIMVMFLKRSQKKSAVTNLNLKVDGVQNLSLVVQNHHQNQKPPIVNIVAQRTKNALIALKIPLSI